MTSREQRRAQVLTRLLVGHRLADGKIVEDDPIQTPDPTQELATLLTPPSA